MSYLDGVSKKHKEYFKVLCNEFPEWLLEYIDTSEMQRIGHTSMDCGCDYSGLFKKHPWHSNLDHSVGVALIVWNFTHDKKQTLAGLFHDIASPTFKHCIDFMNGDSLKQESTEERTYDIISSSKEICKLLKRDNISVGEVCDYKIYPLCDNDSPMLSADRFEYNFSCGFIIHPEIWDLKSLKRCYDDVIVLKNEYGDIELGFKHKNIAEKYIVRISKLWPYWINDEDRITMQFIADICKSMNNLGYLSVDDLYSLSDEEVVNKIRNCDNKEIRDAFNKFNNIRKCYRSNIVPKGKYYVDVTSKRRFINPYVLESNARVCDVSINAKNAVNEYMNVPNSGRVYFNINFKVIKK